MPTLTLKNIEALETYQLTGKQPKSKDFSSFKKLSDNFDSNTFDALMAACKHHPKKTAISFFLSGYEYSNPIRVSYQILQRRIIQTENLFNSREKPNTISSSN